jgi:DNA repair exonuclease SbcCD ATPase subunit
MDQKQVEKRLAWLDEQHRGSTTTLKELSDLLAKAQKQVQTQAKQIADLNDEISRLTGLTTRIHEVDETLKQHRKEVSRQLESAEQRRTEKEANIDSIRKADQQAVSHRVDQIQEELKRIKEIDQTLTTRRDEELRLSKQAAKLDKQVEKLLDKSTNQGDQLKSLIRENAKLLKDYQNIKAELDALRKKGEESRGMLDALKDGSRSLDVRVSELISAESERSEGQARWWKKWGRRFEAIEQQADAFDDRLAAYEEMHRALKQMRTELGELMERLERRITEVSEMQRLSDNRMKHEWSSFQAEDLKRWNTYKLTGDELWREHNRLHDQLAKQYEAFSEDLGQAGQNIKQMLDADRMRLGEFMSMAREWLSDYTDRDD